MTPVPDLPRPDWAARRERWPDPGGVLRDLGVEAGTSLVDVGVHAGYFALPAASLVAPAPVYVIHPDGTLLDELDAAALDAGLGNVTTISGSASGLSALLPERVDVVLVAGSFRAIEGPTAFAEQVARSLRPGGRFVVLESGAGSTAGEGSTAGPTAADRPSPEPVESLVAPTGLEVAARVDLPAEGQGLVFMRGHDR